MRGRGRLSVVLFLHTPDANFVVARLLQNTTDMGDAIRPYYGDAVAKRYSQLLREHITLAGDLVKATAEGNMEKAAEIERNGSVMEMKLQCF